MPRFSGRLREVVRLTRVEPKGVSSRNRSETSTYSKRIYCIHFSSYDTSSARLSLKVPRKQCIQQTWRSDHVSSGRLEEVENNEKL